MAAEQARGRRQLSRGGGEQFTVLHRRVSQVQVVVQRVVDKGG